MSQTKELLSKIITAISEGRLPVENVPIEDVKQCVYAELEVNRSTFTEQQYVEVLDQFERMCENVTEEENDRSKMLLMMDALLLCTDMISQVVYALADRDYWSYKHTHELDDPEVAGIIDYIDREKRIDLISYDFVKEYRTLPVMVYWDEDSNMRYVLHKGRKMFFPGKWDEEKIIEYYRSVIMEQDGRSPHCYAHKTCGVRKGDIVVDAGAAEGIFALDCIELADKLYLIEADPEWIEALEQTFRENRDKVQIVCGFLDSYDDENHVSIDMLMKEEELNYIKMDIEGGELSALAGASNTLKRSGNLRCAICSYHRREDEQSIRDTLAEYGFSVETSRGYICPDWTMEAYLNAELRRGIVFGRKDVGRYDGRETI